MTFRFICYISAFFVLVSCGKETSNSIDNAAPRTSKTKPTKKEIAKGSLSKIYIIADDSNWDNALKDSISYYFQSAFPILPAPEPLYDLMRYTTQEIKNKKERRELRTYLMLIDMNDPDALATQMALQDVGPAKAKEIQTNKQAKLIIGKNKWADNQIIIYAFGYGQDQIIENIRANFNTIDKAIRQVEEPARQKSIYLSGTNSEVKSEVRAAMDINLEVPSDYFLALNDEAGEVIWLRKETDKVSYNIMIKDMGTFDEANFSKEGMKAIRNELGLLVSSNQEDSYMIINDIDLPIVMSSTSFNNNFALEAKGIWELENDFMGGPYISYIIHNPNTNRVIFIDGFVHAPGEEKRDLMLNLKYIIQTLSF